MKTYSVELTKDEMDHIMTCFDLYPSATLRKDGVQLEDSINAKFERALMTEGTENVIEDIELEFDDLDDMTIEDEVYPDGEE